MQRNQCNPAVVILIPAFAVRTGENGVLFSNSLDEIAQNLFESNSARNRQKMANWHRLFGLVLTDFFTGSPYIVELEKDLSLKKQLLDVVIIQKECGAFIANTRRIPAL